MDKIKEQIQGLNITQLKELMSFCKKTLQEKSKKGALHKRCTDVWDTYYQNIKGIKFVYDGAEMNAQKQLINKCNVSLKQHNLKPSDDDICQFYAKFLLSISDPWILEHLSIKMINSKFNSLMAAASKDIAEAENTKKSFERYD